MNKKLPIGIQTFENLIREGYYYVDKTRFLQELAFQGKYYFLSRPRRFGKSLFLSTIKSAFEGKKDLFQGLYLADHWDWSEIHPVVHISFGSGMIRDVQELKTTFSEILYDHALQYDLNYEKKSLKGRFAELIFRLHEMYDQNVVILVDEYDKPMLDNIENTETAAALREELKNYYSVIKDADPHIRFVFITGVSKFSKVSLFSGLNNLEDITVNKRFSSLCGYTEDELNTVFADCLIDVDPDQIKQWYNGYNWLGEEVYNPFDILLYLKTKEFSNYWFETGTPGFLIKLLHTGQYSIPAIEGLSAGEEIVSSFDVEDITAEALLFQTFFSSIPYDWYRKNELAGYEGYYASIFYCYFAAPGLNVHPEEQTNKGRIDLVLRFKGRVYIIEFKVVELVGEDKALKQIKDKRYPDKFSENEVYLIGVEFSSQERNIVGFDWEKMA